MGLRKFLIKERKNKIIDRFFDTQFMRGVLDLPSVFIEGKLDADSERYWTKDSRVDGLLTRKIHFTYSMPYRIGSYISMIPTALIFTGLFLYTESKN